MKLSIIIPCYNAERCLKQCLNSVFSQTIDNYEVICVNDGSTDNTLRILEEYQQLHTNMRVFSQENAGLSCARNSGLEIACGEYIGFVDSDDFIEKNMFEKMLNRALETDSDVVISNPRIYEDNTGKTWPFRNMLDFFHLYQIGGFCPKDNPLVFSLIGPWDKIYKHSLLKEQKIKFIPHRIYEDMPWTFEVLCYAKKVSVVKECLYFYRKNAGGSITDKESTSDNFSFHFLKNAIFVKKLLKKNNLYESVSSVFLKYLLDYGMMHQSHIKNNNNFCEYFHELKDFFDEYDYSIIEKIKVEPKFLWYANTLKSGNLKLCKRMVVSKYRGEN